jgi:hypothetical protein
MGLASLSDTELILLILAAFYLVECLAWVRGSVVLFSSGWRRFRPSRRSGLLGNQESGLVLAHPLPWATAFLCEAWPGAFDAQGFWPPRQAGQPPAEPVPFERMQDLAVRDRQVCLGGRTLVQAASRGHAQHFVASLRRLAETPAAERPPLIDALLAEAVSPASVRGRIDQVWSATATLRLCCVSLFVLVFLLGPLLYYSSLTASQSLRLWVYLAACGADWLLILVSHHAAHRALFPDAPAERRKRFLTMLCSPASALRSGETVGRNALAPFHPLAVAAVACSRARFEALARQTLRELRHPLASSDEPPARTEAETAFRDSLLGHLEALLRTAGMDPETLLAPPAQDPEALSYCPRCQTQYIFPEGACEQCAGLPLSRFAPDSVASGCRNF